MPPPDRSQPAWKAAARGKGQAARGPQRAWKPDAAGAGGGGRRLKLVGFGLGGLACAGLIVWLIILLRPQPGPGLVVLGADPAADADNLAAPLDPYGWRGGATLAKWASETDAAVGRKTPVPRLVTAGQLTPEALAPAALHDWLKKLKQAHGDPVIVYAGLHGGADVAGPFLFAPGGARLDLHELIDGLAGLGKNVVLLLDPARLPPDPALGQLHPDCVRALKDLGPKLKEAKNLVVICSSDAGEPGWNAEEWGTTPFAQAVLAGLSGEADASDGSLITAKDLFHFVNGKVRTWSAGRTPQTPTLLPDGADGLTRAAGIRVSVKVPGRAAEPWPTVKEHFKVPDGLAGHWKACRDLETGTPSPAVYTPLLWRRYRELIPRYEQVVRAGEADAARRLDDALTDAEGRLRAGLGLRLANGQRPTSPGNALPLPAALGLGPDPKAAGAADAAARQLWDARAEPDWDKAWEKAQSDVGNPDLLRARVYDLALAKAASGTRADVDRAVQIMTLQKLGAGIPRPAESHLLVMLRQFYDGKPRGEPPPELWQNAINVRRKAEQAALGVGAPGAKPAHPYSERLWAAFGPAVTAADVHRRTGEDFLFAEPANAHAKAREELAAAEAGYTNVLGRAADLRAALDARDRALADLPLLTRWVAAQPAGNKPGADANPWAEPTRALWAKVHDLARRLDAPATGGDDVRRLTGEVNRGVGELRDAYRTQCAELTADRDLPQLRVKADRVLAVPPLAVDPAVRQGLMEGAARQGEKLSNEWTTNPKDVALPTAAAVEDAKTARRDQAVQQAKLAVAVLGDLSTDLSVDTKADLLSTDNLQGDAAKIADDRDRWPAAATQLGDHIARQWRRLAAGPDKDLPANPVRDEMRSRWAVAFRADAVPEPEAATANRLRRWRDLFAGLALRTATDHWYEADGAGEAYFLRACDLYLKDANQAVVASDAAKPSAKDDPAVKGLLEAPPLELKPYQFESVVQWTSETKKVLTVNASAPKPGGFVTLWPELVDGKGELSLEDGDKPRQARELPAAKEVLHLDAKRFATDDTVTLVTHAWFRGQRKKLPTEIKVTRTPELVLTRTPPPGNAAVAVRADDDLDLGSIAIVLDFSGSMKAVPGGGEDWKNPNSKNQQALRTLRDVLIDLPSGTPISLRLFGHAEAFGPRPVFDKDRFPGRMAQLRQTGMSPTDAEEVAGSELTKSELIYSGTVKWNRDNPRPLDDAILNKLKSAEPKYWTPLLRTMIEAKDDFKDTTKPKTLLVLTDGADTTYPQADRVDEIKKQFNKEFGLSDVAIQMVLFRVSKAEEDTAKQQFEQLPKMKNPGHIWVAAKNDELTKAIDLALRPKLQILQKSGAPAPEMALAGLGIGMPANRQRDRLHELLWTPALTPAQYDAKVFDTLQPLNLSPGDRLLVQLKKESTGVRFERYLLADEMDRHRVNRDGPWALALPWYRARDNTNDTRLAMTATLEARTDLAPGTTGELKQPRPRFVWWEAAPKAGPERPSRVQVDERYGLPAPAWDLAAARWPAAGGVREARVRAWVGIAQPPAHYTLSIPEVARLEDDGGLPLAAEGEDGRVEAIATLEDWSLRTKADEDRFWMFTGDLTRPPWPPQKCLVVRILHPPGKPVFVRPSGYTFAAEEHQYFPGPHAVTAVFGPVTKDELAARLSGRELKLELVSVERFKETAQKVSLEDLGVPGTEQPQVNAPDLGSGAKAVTPPGG